MERAVMVLYGSETGTAQSLAERVVREARRLHLGTRLSSMDDFCPAIRDLADRYRLVVFVCSTTGQGDQPENMRRFWKFLLRKNLPTDCLIGLNFGVVALGDSSYQKFNFVGKRLFRRLQQLGARPLLPLALCDEQHDLGHDFVADPWLKNFWAEVLAIMPLPEGLAPIPEGRKPDPKYKLVHLDEGAVVSVPSDNRPTRSPPVLAELLSRERVTSETHFQDTRLVKLGLSSHGNSVHYEPGDVCMVQPRNLAENVLYFFEELFPHLDPSMRFDLELWDTMDGSQLPPAALLPLPCTLRDCVEGLWDIQSIPGRYFFELLSHFAPEDDAGRLEFQKLRELSSAAGQEERYDYCNRPRRHCLEVLFDFRHTRANVPLEYLFDLFPTIKPRAFSIASCQTAVPDQVHLLMAVVNYSTKRLVAPRLGLCSNWLIRLDLSSKVPISIKKGTFKFPADEGDSAPVVMVGPGTGVAPFYSYVCQQMSLGSTTRKLALFFGCRGRHSDFYFAEDWSKWAAQGQVRNNDDDDDDEARALQVFPAFSRDQEDKVYVQHLMLENSALLYRMVFEERGRFYVAGNSKQMPDQVADALKEALKKHHPDGLTDEEAAQTLARMEAEQRYQTETWS